MERWPELRYAQWKDTCATLHMWLQIVGKTELLLQPKRNHWWHVALLPSARGLWAPPMPSQDGTFDLEFDLIAHELVLRTSDGRRDAIALGPRPVAEFYEDYRAMLAPLGVRLKDRDRPVEVVESIPFADDIVHASYDRVAAAKCARILQESARVFAEFRGRFLGKSSPVHVWWGAFDLACTRFSGRTAPRHPGGYPNVGDHVMIEAYSHECISAGWWPGTDTIDAAYYAYAYPEPEGCPHARITPDEGRYDLAMHEWILPYDAVRRASDPDRMILDFLQSTYEAAATLGKWDRAALEAR